LQEDRNFGGIIEILKPSEKYHGYSIEGKDYEWICGTLVKD
jgi:hypothetical protein